MEKIPALLAPKKTDTIVVEYIRKPIVDCSYSYLWRFAAPVIMNWFGQTFTVTFAATFGSGKNELKWLEEEALRQWKVIWKVRKGLKKAGIDWMPNLKKVKLVECEIVPKP